MHLGPPESIQLHRMDQSLLQIIADRVTVGVLSPAVSDGHHMIFDARNGLNRGVNESKPQSSCIIHLFFVFFLLIAHQKITPLASALSCGVLTDLSSNALNPTTRK